MSLQYFREYKKTLRVCEITYASTIYTQLYGKKVYFYGKLNKAIKIKPCKSNVITFDWEMIEKINTIEENFLNFRFL